MWAKVAQAPLRHRAHEDHPQPDYQLVPLALDLPPCQTRAFGSDLGQLLGDRFVACVAKWGDLHFAIPRGHLGARFLG